MLINITGLNKTYRTAGGVTHRALANINLQFDDKGLTFVVGKSGSGKSTLLNMLGGLDRYDSGTVVVGGKNLGKMSAREQDNYRNTMIGFIFQEPNLVENLSVLENVKLALNLQKAPDATARAKKTLESVGLGDKLKTNVQNLSGGQRQRVAIARALAKNPQLLLADEPTGALDSVTGEGIMSLLREIAKDRLVVVVTHDMDMAAKCGDRIIEMKDSRIYRDIMPRPEGYVDNKADISFISDSIVKVAPGERFDDLSTGKLNSILSDGGRKTFVNIDTDKKKMKALFPNLREAIDAGSTRATEDGGYEYEGKFVPYEPADRKQSTIALKKGRLPLKNAIGFGLNNLKHKTVRLFFTVLMTIITLTLFGFVQTIYNFDADQASARTVTEGNFSSINVTDVAGYNNNVKLNPSDLNAVADKTGHTVNYSYSYSMNVDDAPYVPLSGFIEVRDAAGIGFQTVSGDLTFTSEQSPTDIAISESTALSLAKSGMASSVNEMVGRSVSICGVPHTVKGIFAYDLTEAEYNAYSYYYTDHVLVKEGYHELFIDSYSLGSAYMELRAPDGDQSKGSSVGVRFDSDIAEWLETGDNIKAIKHDEIAGGGTTLEKGEIFIGENLLVGLGLSYENASGGVSINALNSFVGRDLVLYASQYGLTARPLYASDTFKIKGVFTNNTSYVDESGNSIQFEIVDGIDIYTLASSVVFSEEDRNAVLSGALYSSRAIIRLDDMDDATNERLILSLLSSGYALSAQFVSAYSFMMFFLYMMSVIMLVVAGVMCLLTVLMLYGYLSSSIKLTTKQIGILRGLGAKLTDCFKIYIVEAIIICLIACVVSAVLIAVISPIVNAALSVEYGFPFFLLLPGAGVYLMITGIALAVSVVSVLLPLRKLTKISPVEAIFGKQ